MTAVAGNQMAENSGGKCNAFENTGQTVFPPLCRAAGQCRLKGFQTALPGLSQSVQQFGVYSAETAVAHHQNMVAGSGVFHNFGNEGIEIFTDAQPAAQRREGFGNVPVRAADR